MSGARTELLQLKDAISEMPIEDQLKIKNLAHSLRTLLFVYGDTGQIALSLVAGEMALKEELSEAEFAAALETIPPDQEMRS